MGIIPMSTLKPEEVKWYWFPRIPLGGITMVFGKAGIGKSTIVYDILSRASTASPMPNSAVPPPAPNDTLYAKSLIVGTEDTPERVAAVLDRANADLDFLGILPQDALPNPRLAPLEQLAFVERSMLQFGARVLYIDNVSEALVGDSVDSNNERSVRAALRPLDMMAKRNGWAVILTTHPKKGAEKYDVNEGITGSQAFTNLARSVMFVARVPHSDMFALSVSKSNYYPWDRANTLGYKVHSEVLGTDAEGHEILSIPWVEWMGRLPYNAKELSAMQAEEAGELLKKAGDNNGMGKGTY